MSPPSAEIAFQGYKRFSPSNDGGFLIRPLSLERSVAMRYRLAYVGIQVRDLDRSIGFYCDLLGMQVVRRQRVPETSGEWAELRSPGSDQMLELNWYPEDSTFFAGPYKNGDELDHIAFACEDVPRAYAELLAKGAGVGHPPFVEDHTVLAYVTDPDGIWIELTGSAPT